MDDYLRATEGDCDMTLREVKGSSRCVGRVSEGGANYLMQNADLGDEGKGLRFEMELIRKCCEFHF